MDTETIKFILQTALFVSIATEALKKTKKIKISYNILVLIVSAVVTLAGQMLHYVTNTIPYSFNFWLSYFPLTLFVWITSMVGYDKLIQTISQKEKYKEKDDGE